MGIVGALSGPIGCVLVISMREARALAAGATLRWMLKKLATMNDGFV